MNLQYSNLCSDDIIAIHAADMLVKRTFVEQRSTDLDATFSTHSTLVIKLQERTNYRGTLFTRSHLHSLDTYEAA